MRWWDIAEVVELEALAYPHDPWSAESFWGELAQGGYYVVDDERGIDGYAGLTVSFDEASVQTVAVALTARSRGVGGALLDSLLEIARSQSARKVFLEVASRNEHALRLYRSRGFVEIGRRNGYYVAEHDDAIVMAVTL